ncbi:MAG: sugar transporter [Candidatus Binatia bacterium]|nr:MAG: sugar transporter [Candidatus Binatia bacterium]
MSAPGPLPVSVLLRYGVGQLGYSMMGLAVYVHLPKFYTDVALLSPALVGLVVLIARVWDAVTDPVMGYVSDRTRTRLGRRRPYLVASSIPAGLCFALLWSPPPEFQGEALFFYFLAAYMGLFLCWTIGAIPYYSFGAELSPDYYERTRLVGVREMFSVSGIILGTLGVPLALHLFDDTRQAYAAMGAAVGAAGAATILVPALFLREPRIPEGVHVLPPWTGLVTTLRNPAFRVLLVTYFFTSVAGAVPGPLIPYISEYVVKTPHLLPAYILVYLLMGILTLPLWVRISRRIGKKKAWSFALLIAVFVTSGLFFLGPGRSTLFFFLLAVGGVSLGGSLAFPASMQADVIDQDELLTGKRREGAYFGLWSLVTKSSAAVTLFVAMQVLHLAGYVPNVEQSPDVVLTMRLLYSFFPASCYAAALLLFQRYPITQEVHAEIRARLAARAA